jgi:hypothetical protein
VLERHGVAAAQAAWNSASTDERHEDWEIPDFTIV